jgi:hypothetical protein
MKVPWTFIHSINICEPSILLDIGGPEDVVMNETKDVLPLG